MSKIVTVLVSSLTLWAVTAVAEPGVPKHLLDTLARVVPDATPSRVTPTPLPGLFEVMYGPELFYISEDGRYVVRGDVLDLQEKRNLSEESKAVARLQSLDALGDANMVVFAPAETKHTVTVFTDIECGYCVRLHQEVPELNRRGIKVRYLAFPRAGEGSSAYRKAVSVWCADDRNQAMTDAKAGKAIAEKDCANPVLDQYEAGKALGITGTPTLVLDDGRMVPGYVPAPQLAQALERNQP